MIYSNGCPEGSKVSRLALWNQVLKQTGNAPEGLLDRPPFPQELNDLWVTYNKLAGGKESISYNEIYSYMRVMNEYLTPWEIDLIFKLEGVRNG